MALKGVQLWASQGKLWLDANQFNAQLTHLVNGLVGQVMQRGVAWRVNNKRTAGIKVENLLAALMVTRLSCLKEGLWFDLLLLLPC